jgi:hypothetical protein
MTIASITEAKNGLNALTYGSGPVRRCSSSITDAASRGSST